MSGTPPNFGLLPTTLHAGFVPKSCSPIEVNGCTAAGKAAVGFGANPERVSGIVMTEEFGALRSVLVPIKEDIIDANGLAFVEDCMTLAEEPMTCDWYGADIADDVAGLLKKLDIDSIDAMGFASPARSSGTGGRCVP